MDPLVERGIELFNRGEFFECHEVLEEAWTPERGPRRLFLQSLIHVAVGFYQARRGNPVGACRQLRKALRKMAAYLPACEGVHTEKLFGEAREVLEKIEAGREITEFPKMQRLSVQRGDTERAEEGRGENKIHR